MLRLALIEIGLFLAPFAVYALWLRIARGGPAQRDWAGGPLFAMTLAGLVLMILGFVALASFGPAEQGSYRPAEVRDGVLVPGHFE